MEKDTNLIPDFEGFEDFVVDITEEELNDKRISKEQDDGPEVHVDPEEESVPEPENKPETEPEKEPEPETLEVDDKEAATALYKTLVAKGTIAEDKDFDGSWEKLDSYFDSLPERVAEDIIASAPDITKKLFEFAFVSGDDITVDSLKSFMKTYLEDVEAANTDIDVSTTESARKFLETELSKSLKSAVAVSAALDAMEDDGSLIEEAKARAEEKKKQNNHQAIIDNKVEQNRQMEEASRQRTLKIQSEINSGNYSKEAVSEMVGFLKQENSVNNTLKDVFNSPKAFVQLLSLLPKFDRSKGEFNFDSFIKEAATPEIKKIKSSILKDNFSSVPKTSAKKDISPTKKYESIEPIVEY